MLISNSSITDSANDPNDELKPEYVSSSMIVLMEKILKKLEVTLQEI